uniref:Neur_chan_memb domain-containing protein n=1 Tax=Caenorhabditis japonica TaxID=281687 RepID=A0A8R1EJR7_CAEJA
MITRWKRTMKMIVCQCTGSFILMSISKTNYLQKLKPYLCAQNNTAPTVAFRKTKRQKTNTVDDVVFVNLLNQVRFIAEHFRHNELEGEISDDWTFVAMVLDRLFLIIFSVLNVGTVFIILESPSLYDYSKPMNITVPSKPLGQANFYSSWNLK